VDSERFWRQIDETIFVRHGKLLQTGLFHGVDPQQAIWLECQETTLYQTLQFHLICKALDPQVFRIFVGEDKDDLVRGLGFDDGVNLRYILLSDELRALIKQVQTLSSHHEDPLLTQVPPS
jgi:hypothetical protein